MNSEMDATQARWLGFIESVQKRVQEILAEADAGFDQIVAMSAADTTAMTGAVTAFESRMIALGLKVSDAQTKLAGSYLGSALDDLMEMGDQLQHDIEIKTNRMSVAKRAKAASALYETAKRDMEQPLLCQNCGGVLEITVRHKASSPVCPFCKTVNQVQTSTPVGHFYYGGCVQALAEQASIDQWCEKLAAEKRIDDMRNPSAADIAGLKKISENYWQTYFDAMVRLHPDWQAEQIPAEIRVKMKGFDTRYN